MFAQASMIYCGWMSRVTWEVSPEACANLQGGLIAHFPAGDDAQSANSPCDGGSVDGEELPAGL